MAFPMMPKTSMMSDEDLYSVIAFLRSDDEMVEEKENHLTESKPGFFLKALMKFAIKPVPYNGEPLLQVPSDDELAYGKYLVNGRYSCFECHSRSTSEINYLNPTESTGYLGGGSRLLVYGNDIGIRSANITPHPDYGIGNWSFMEFRKAVTDGIRPDGKVLRPPMNRLQLDSTEIKAIWSYLQTVPALPFEWKYMDRIELPAK